MTKQKRGFWTFVFSLIPGAGEMYMGFMRRGMSIMIVFWLLIALSGLMSTGIFLFGIPLLWFYSFFNVHNLKGLSEEEFYSIQDDYAFHIDEFVVDKGGFVRKYRNVIAGIFILIGCSILWDGLYRVLLRIIPENFHFIVYFISDIVPKFAVGIGIILLGILLIRGKKKELEDHENA